MKKFFKTIGWIFSTIWKVLSFVRQALANLLFLVIIILIYMLYIHMDTPTEPKLKTPSALVLNLSGPIVEQSRYDNPVSTLTSSLTGGEAPRENVLFDIVQTIRHAKNDPKISGLVLSLKNMPETNLTKLRYIAKALNEFKAAGKPIYAVGDRYNQSQYYLASYANKVYLAPNGHVQLKGYNAYVLYYKQLLDKLDVTTHVFRVGTYKSAVEPFIRNDMSPAAKLATTRWLKQLWGAYVDDVATNRHISAKVLNPTPEQLLAEMKSVNGDMAQLSLKLGLVDKLATRQQIRTALAKSFGSDGQDSYKAISYYDYQTTLTPHYDNNARDIAVVVASGAIMDGRQPRGAVGGDSVAALLRKARNDDNVKAVVLRVDSPGGSAFASEIIRSEVQALKDAGKPVIVSMSSLAASGGYWISMSADKIVAQPTTLTGSIGIFSVITTFEKGLNKYGIHTDGIGTSPLSGSGLTTGLSKTASQALQMGIENGYHRFISLVAKNRGMSLSQVDDIAQGRVWTGQDALQRGLVDQMGDFDDAIKLAAKMAKLKTYNIYHVQQPLSPMSQFVQQFMGQASAATGINIESYIPKALIPVSRQLHQDSQLLSSFNDPQGFYAFCLNCQVE